MAEKLGLLETDETWSLGKFRSKDDPSKLLDFGDIWAWELFWCIFKENVR